MTKARINQSSVTRKERIQQLIALACLIIALALWVAGAVWLFFYPKSVLLWIFMVLYPCLMISILVLEGKDYVP